MHHQRAFFFNSLFLGKQRREGGCSKEEDEFAIFGFKPYYYPFFLSKVLPRHRHFANFLSWIEVWIDWYKQVRSNWLVDSEQVIYLPTITRHDMMTLNDYIPILYHYVHTGVAQWVTTGTGDKEEWPTSLAWDHKGGIIVMGGFTSSTLTIGTTTISNLNPTIGGSSVDTTTDVFLMKVGTTDGSLVWLRHYGGEYDEYPYKVSSSSNKYTRPFCDRYQTQLQWAARSSTGKSKDCS